MKYNSEVLWYKGVRQRQNCWWRTEEIKHYLFFGTFQQEFTPLQPTDPTHSAGKPRDPLIFIQIPRIHNIFHQSQRFCSLKLLSNINYSKILFLTFSTQMFLEWPCCRRGTTFPLNASPHSTFCLYFPGYFQTQHFHCHFAKNNHQLLKNSYPVSQNGHKNTPFLLASESTVRV